MAVSGKKINELEAVTSLTDNSVLPVVVVNGSTPEPTAKKVTVKQLVGDSLPSQIGNAGKSLITNGTTISWDNVQEIQEQNNDGLIKFWYGTQNEYDALETYDPNTNYIIVDNDQTLSTLLATQNEFNTSVQNKAATPYQVNNKLNNYSLITAEETITGATPSITLASNTIFNAGEVTSITLSLPATVGLSFITQVNFSSGSTATTFTAPSSIYFDGDGCDNGEFTAAANHRYCMLIMSDGINMLGFVYEK